VESLEAVNAKKSLARRTTVLMGHLEKQPAFLDTSIPTKDGSESKEVITALPDRLFGYSYEAHSTIRNALHGTPDAPLPTTFNLRQKKDPNGIPAQPEDKKHAGSQERPWNKI
jgi:hypothetical protein